MCPVELSYTLIRADGARETLRTVKPDGVIAKLPTPEGVISARTIVTRPFLNILGPKKIILMAKLHPGMVSESEQEDSEALKVENIKEGTIFVSYARYVGDDVLQKYGETPAISLDE